MENIELYKGYNKTNNIIQIKTIVNIDDFIDAIRVFRGKPYYEILDKEDCEAEYELYKQKGIALGFYIDDKIAGLNCFVFEADKKHSVCFYDKDNIAYYSGLAVKPEYRGLGIGKMLVKTSEEYLALLNKFDYGYARILLNGSMSEGIFQRFGYEDVYVDNQLIVDEVTYKRNNPNVSETDERKYMIKKLTKTASPYYRK